MDSLLAWSGRRLVARAESNARRRKLAGSVLNQVWHLIMVLGGLSAVTYGVYQVADWAGWIAGGLCAFVARSLITWEAPDAPRS